MITFDRSMYGQISVLVAVAILKKLDGICGYAIVVFIRCANRGPWASCFISLFDLLLRLLL